MGVDVCYYKLDEDNITFESLYDVDGEHDVYRAYNLDSIKLIQESCKFPELPLIRLNDMYEDASLEDILEDNNINLTKFSSMTEEAIALRNEWTDIEISKFKKLTLAEILDSVENMKIESLYYPNHWESFDSDDLRWIKELLENLILHARQGYLFYTCS